MQLICVNLWAEKFFLRELRDLRGEKNLLCDAAPPRENVLRLKFYGRSKTTNG